MPENQEAGRPRGELTFKKSTSLKEAGNQSLFHPAETFSWLPKEEYIKRRNEYVTYWAPIGEKALSEDPQFRYRDNPEIVRTAATVFARTFFIADYLREQQPYDKSIPVRIQADTQTVNSNMRAGTVPIFYLHGEPVSHYPQIAPADVEHVKLREVHIYTNLNRLGDDISDTMEFVKQLKQDGEPEQDVDGFYADRIGWHGIKQEQAMVEEIAHAIYFINATGELGTRKQLFEDFKRSPWMDETIDKRWTPEEREIYRSLAHEQDAAKWVKAFTRCYYPEIAEEAEER